jgi:hypothetical protein
VKPEILAALKSLEVDGKLTPADVVEAARSKSSPLHDQFTWDDGEAAHQYRLIEARKLIQVQIEYLPRAKADAPVYVSLRDDRAAPGGGYRLLAAVLSKEALRDKLLSDALDDLKHFKQKYHMLAELAEVFSAMAKIKKAS